MTDYFTLLEEPRRPWLDAERLKEKFLARSASVHPDRVHGLGTAERAAAHEHFTELNAAYACLREPKDRLRHWLELELGAPPRDLQNIPADLMDLSLGIGQLCRQTDSFLAERNRTSSPLLQVQMFQRGQEWTGKIQVLQKQTATRLEKLLHEVQEQDAAWDSASLAERRDRLTRLEEVYRLLSYFTRWQGQLQERFIRLLE